MDVPQFPSLAPDTNPLLRSQTVEAVPLENLTCPTILVRKRTARRELRDVRRRKTAAEAIAGLTHDLEIFGFTKGQFSLLDLLIAALQITGPAQMSLSTWTAARHEIQSLDELQRSGLLTGMRWLVDFTFCRRDPEAAHQVRKTFGADAIRVANTHCKFAVLRNDTWSLVIRTSMNLNMNPRFEDFTVAHDEQLSAFLGTLLDDIWTRQKRELAEGTSHAEVRRHFVADL